MFCFLRKKKIVFQHFEFEKVVFRKIEEMDIPVKCLPSKSQQKREENEYLREELRVDGLDLDMDDIDEKADSNLAASKKKQSKQSFCFFTALDHIYSKIMVHGIFVGFHFSEMFFYKLKVFYNFSGIYTILLFFCGWGIVFLSSTVLRFDEFFVPKKWPIPKKEEGRYIIDITY